MLINDEIEIERINKKLKVFFDIDKYSDFLFLTSEKFEPKYGGHGFSFSDFITVRFDAEADSLTEICDLLPENEHYFILLENGTKSFYKVEKSQASQFLAHHDAVNFVIFEKKMTWSLIYDHHRKLTGLGNYIKKKMKKNINQRFGQAKIMFVNSSVK